MHVPNEPTQCRGHLGAILLANPKATQNEPFTRSIPGPMCVYVLFSEHTTPMAFGLQSLFLSNTPSLEDIQDLEDLQGLEYLQDLEDHQDLEDPEDLEIFKSRSSRS